MPCRDARLNAKIDSAAGTVVMGTSFQTAYETNLENAKALSSRTFMLANAVGAVSRA
jgi:translation initiation factor 3 subunit E